MYSSLSPTVRSPPAPLSVTASVTNPTLSTSPRFTARLLGFLWTGRVLSTLLLGGLFIFSCCSRCSPALWDILRSPFFSRFVLESQAALSTLIRGPRELKSQLFFILVVRFFPLKINSVPLLCFHFYNAALFSPCANFAPSPLTDTLLFQIIRIKFDIKLIRQYLCSGF